MVADAEGPWWIIASAAVALHGVDPGPIGDVDVLMDAADARRFAVRQSIVIGPGVSDGRFRSALFGRWDAPPVDVEIMAELEIMSPDGWQPVLLVTRMIVATAGGPVYIPKRRELISVLRTFSRPKDLRRAVLLEDTPS